MKKKKIQNHLNHIAVIIYKKKKLKTLKKLLNGVKIPQLYYKNNLYCKQRNSIIIINFGLKKQMKILSNLKIKSNKQKIFKVKT